MDDTRAYIARLIKEISQREKDLKSLIPSQLESLVAELSAQHQYIEEFKRSMAPSADMLLSIRDQHNVISKYAIEVKQTQKLIDDSVVKAFRDNIDKLNIDKAFLVTNSLFTESARKLAEDYKNSMQLIDHEALLNWTHQYQAVQEKFAASLFSSVWRLPLHDFLVIKEDEITKEEVVEPTTLIFPPEHHDRVVRAENIPFRLIHAILHDPRHMHDLTPRQFEEFIAEVVEHLGFSNIILTSPSGDGGRDVIASNEINGIPMTLYFECKKYAEGNKVQLNTLRSLLGTVAHHATEANIGVLVTTSTFTKGCKDLIMSDCRLDGKDYDGLLGWVSELKRKIK